MAEWNSADGPSRKWESGAEQKVSKREAKSIVEAVCFPQKAGESGKCKSMRGSSSGGILHEIKKQTQPRQTKQALTKQQLRKLVQGKDEETRASKRQSLMGQSLVKQRSASQTFLEAAAVAPRTAEEYKYKLRMIQGFCKAQKLKTQGVKNIDEALLLFLNQCFTEGWTHAEGVKCLAAVHN